MSGWFLGIFISISILFFGIVGLIFLIKKYREKLLVNFSQKVQMTFWLAVIFGLFFLAGNGILFYYSSSFNIKDNFEFYVQHPLIVVRAGLVFFILNSFLLLACRSLIKALSHR